MKKFVLLGLVLLCLPLVFSDMFYDSNYLLGDEGAVLVCNANDALISCYDGTIRKFTFNQTCDIYTFRTDKISCADPYLEVDTGREPKQLPLGTYGLPLVYYEKTINESDPVQVAYSLYTSKLLDHEEDMLYYLDTLRDLRNETKKCWPLDACDISQTADILYLLDRAGFNETVRIYQDAKLWLQSTQIKEQYDDWFIRIESRDNATCNLRKGSSSFQSLEFDDDDTLTHTFDLFTTSHFNVTCDEDFEYWLYDDNYKLISTAESKRIEEDPNLYGAHLRFNPGCLPLYEGYPQNCDLFSTVEFLQLGDIESDVLNLGESYLEDDELDEKQVGSSVSDDMLTNVYAYAILEDVDVETWILYSQGNDGNFAHDATVTLEALRILNNTNDWTIDAHEWVTSNYVYGGWSSIYADILMYEQYEPNEDAIYILEGNLAFSEPKQKITFSESVENVTLIQNSVFTIANEKNVVGITTDVTKDGRHNAQLLVNNRLRYPIVYTREPRITFEIPDEFYLIKESGEVEMTIIPSDSIVSCDILPRTIFEHSFVNFSESAQITVPYAVVENGVYDVIIDYECNSTFQNIEGTYYTTVIKETTPPIDLKLKGEGTLEKPYELHVYNKLSRSIPISASWLDFVPTHALPDSFTLNPSEKGIIVIGQTAGTNLPENVTKTLEIETLGYTDTINISLEILDNPVTLMSPTVNVVKTNTWLVWLMYIGIVVVIVIVLSFLRKIVFVKKDKKVKKDPVAKNSISQEKRAEFHSLLNQLRSQQEQTKEIDKELSAEKNILDGQETDTIRAKEYSIKQPDVMSSVEESHKEKLSVEKDEPKPEKKHPHRATKAAEVYIELQRRLGVDDDQIYDDLFNSGYSYEEISDAYAELGEVELELSHETRQKIQNASETAESEDSKDSSEKSSEEKKDDEKKESSQSKDEKSNS